MNGGNFLSRKGGGGRKSGKRGGGGDGISGSRNLEERVPGGKQSRTLGFFPQPEFGEQNGLGEASSVEKKRKELKKKKGKKGRGGPSGGRGGSLGTRRRKTVRKRKSCDGHYLIRPGRLAVGNF